MEIIVKFRACDGYRETRRFKTRKGAREYAVYWLGKYPEIGSGYAVSGDGVGTIQVVGCKISEIFAGI